MMDKYDYAIQIIEDAGIFRHEVAIAIEDACYYCNHPSAVLFQFCAPRITAEFVGVATYCGRIWEVKAGKKIAWTQELTKQIREDDRLPSREEDIRPAHLEVFAEYQRLMDEMLKDESNTSRRLYRNWKGTPEGEEIRTYSPFV